MQNRYKELIPSFLVLYAAIGTMFPFVALWMRQTGFSNREVAWIMGAGGLSMIVTSQFWGYVADMILSPLRVLLLSTVLSGLIYMLYPLHPTFLILVLLSCLLAFFNTPRPQMLNSLLMKADGGPENFSLVRAYGSLGFVLLNLPMGYICKYYGYHWQFPIFMVTNGVLFFLLLFLRDTPLPVKFERIRFIEVQKFFAADHSIVLFLIMVLVYQGAHGLSALYLALLLEDMNISSSTIAWFYSFAALVEIPLFFFGDRLIRKVGTIRLMGVACVCHIARWLIVYSAGSAYILFASQVLHAITFGLFFATTVIYITNKTPENLRSSALTLLSIFYFGFSSFLGNLLGGEMAELFGLRNFYLFSAGLAFIAFCLLVKLARIEMKTKHT